VVDHDHQKLESALVADLVDPDPAQPGQTVMLGVYVGPDPRVMIDPTVRQATRIRAVAVDFEDWVANQATVSSKA
jgi:hypothetical protein